jgi:hypothetical protein
MAPKANGYLVVRRDIVSTTAFTPRRRSRCTRADRLRQPGLPGCGHAPGRRGAHQGHRHAARHHQPRHGRLTIRRGPVAAWRCGRSCFEPTARTTARSEVMGVALKDLRGKVKRPVRSVTVCLDGDLWSRHDELTAKLDELRAQSPGQDGSGAGAREAAEELRAVEEADGGVVGDHRVPRHLHLRAQRDPGQVPGEGQGAAAGTSTLALPPCWRRARSSPPLRPRRGNCSTSATRPSRQAGRHCVAGDDREQ